MNPIEKKNGRRMLKALVAPVVVAVFAALFAASPALAAFGDDFGMAPVNGGGGQVAPALPGDHAFWAGSCDIAAAPAIGVDMAGIGGVGARPSQILAPDTYSIGGLGFKQTAVSAPPLPAHCVAWGAPGPFPGPVTSLWNQPPAWRLPPLARAGSRPDGSATFAFNRGTTDTRVDGSVDNIYVDLPPGFVGNPNAVPKCTSEQFDETPMRCPPETQVGVLHLEIEGVLFNNASNLNGGVPIGLSEDVYPVYNLVPRQGRTAEFGFAYASGERVTQVRITGKARTNGDFGVTTFVGQIPAGLPVIAQQITLWGVPWAAHNDRWRAPAGYEPTFGTANPCAIQPGTSPSNGYYIPPAGFATTDCQAHYSPSWGDTPAERTIKPFLTNETDCRPGTQDVTTAMDSYQDQGAFTSEGDVDLTAPSNWKTYSAEVPTVTDCASLDFGPDIEFAPTSTAADSASGLQVELDVPQKNLTPFDPPAPGAGQGAIDDYVADATDYWRSDEGRATAHLKDTVVKLPKGVSVNLSAAPGLTHCGDDQIGLRQDGAPPLFDNVDPFDGVGSPAAGTECPDGSKIGTVEVQTPLLDETLTGDVVLGTPRKVDHDSNPATAPRFVPESGEMLRLFLVVRNKERGLVAKIYGTTAADPVTGQLTTTFANNPELPFDHLSLDIKGGSRGVLAMQQRCESAGWSTDFTPWSAAYGAGGQPVADGGSFTTDSNCGFGFSPNMAAGMDNNKGGGSGTFAFTFSRQDGEQWFKGLTAELPQGLLGTVRDVPLCTNAQADANACPAASRLGSVDAAAGSGDPFVLEKKGSIYLTEGYKGAPYGLAVSIPAEGGPFKDSLALDPVVVRQALHVDRDDASVTAVSDPFPTIWQGFPLRVRDVTVKIDRSGFMRNPTDCSPQTIRAILASNEGANATRDYPFQASGCRNLGFKPKLTLRLTGKKQKTTGKHPGIRAQVTQLGGESGVEKAVVRLPKSLALDVNNAQALCEFADGTKDDLENHCPKGSIVGRARAVSPLLREPLTGDAFFVKNIRIDPDTGNQIRTLPMIIVALRGEVAINLRGVSDTTKSGRLVNTFDNVPDAPIDRFNLNIAGGKNGILAVTRTRRARINLCAKPKSHVAEADFDGQNGKTFDRDITMKTPCAKKAAKKKRATAKKRR
jgi:hypothetical protein